MGFLYFSATQSFPKKYRWFLHHLDFKQMSKSLHMHKTTQNIPNY